MEYDSRCSRWPPVYDEDGLRQVIADLSAGSLFDEFFWPVTDEPAVCQGDIVALTADIPCIDAGGETVATDQAGRWMVIGNTCDFARLSTEADVPWTQLVPLIDLGGDADFDGPELAALRRYRYSRRFYVPPWPALEEVRHHCADFLRPVAAEKGVFGTHARVVARLSFRAWVLLHSCLVRFLARGDGRFDPA